MEPAPGTMKRAVAYVRVSTAGQPGSGLGLDAQPEAVTAFAKTNGFKIETTFEEAETGKGTDALDRRPRLAAALKAARKAGGPVIVAKLDRLSRDVAFIAGLMAHKAAEVLARDIARPMMLSPRRMMRGRSRMPSHATVSGSHRCGTHSGLSMSFGSLVAVLRNGGSHLLALALGLS